MTPVLLAQGLVVDFGAVRAVGGFDLSVGEAASVALVGRNGAGKSTTMRVLAGVLPPTAGTVQVAGRDAATDPSGVRAAVGYCPDVGGLIPRATPWEHLQLAARLRGIYLGVASLGLVFIGQHVLNTYTSVTGGFNGRTTPDFALFGFSFGNSDPDLYVAGVEFGEAERLWYLGLALALVSYLFARNLLRSRAGRALQTLRDSEVAAAVMGVDVQKYKARVFLVHDALQDQLAAPALLDPLDIVPVELRVELLPGPGAERGHVAHAFRVADQVAEAVAPCAGHAEAPARLGHEVDDVGQGGPEQMLIVLSVNGIPNFFAAIAPSISPSACCMPVRPTGASATGMATGSPIIVVFKERLSMFTATR